LCFGFQNKLTFLYGRSTFTDKLLSCTYCLGFHCGWMVWLGDWLVNQEMPGHAGSVIMWAFAASAFCYIADALVRFFESHTLEQRDHDEEES